MILSLTSPELVLLESPRSCSRSQRKKTNPCSSSSPCLGSVAFALRRSSAIALQFLGHCSRFPVFYFILLYFVCLFVFLLPFLGLTLFLASLCQTCWCTEAACFHTSGGLSVVLQRAGRQKHQLPAWERSRCWVAKRSGSARLGVFPVCSCWVGVTHICMDLFPTVFLYTTLLNGCRQH